MSSFANPYYKMLFERAMSQQSGPQADSQATFGMTPGTQQALMKYMSRKQTDKKAAAEQAIQRFRQEDDARQAQSGVVLQNDARDSAEDALFRNDREYMAGRDQRERAYQTEGKNLREAEANPVPQQPQGIMGSMGGDIPPELAKEMEKYRGR